MAYLNTRETINFLQEIKEDLGKDTNIGSAIAYGKVTVMLKMLEDAYSEKEDK